MRFTPSHNFPPLKLRTARPYFSLRTFPVCDFVYLRSARIFHKAFSRMTYKEKLRDITTFVFDFDGVFTDGTVFLMPPSDFVRTMNVRDSYAVQYAVKKGYRIAIITGGNSETVKERMAYLGVQEVFLRASDKLPVLDQFLGTHGLKPENVLYMGDDLPDYPVLEKVGLPCCPFDAAEEIKSIVQYISPFSGGKGCVRDVIEQTLKVQGQWFDRSALHW